MDENEVVDEGVPHMHDDGTAHVHAPVESNGAEGYDIPDKQKAICAFVVVMLEDGKAVADGNLAYVEGFVFNKDASVDDMWRACAEIQQDIEYMKQANINVNAHLNAVSQIQQQQQSQKIAAKLQEKGLRIPGQ